MADSPEHLRALCDRWLAAADEARTKEEEVRLLEAALRCAQAAYRLSREHGKPRVNAEDRA
jgi:hypothetical protein